MKPILRAWSALWFSEGSAWPLGIFRVLMAIALALDVSSSERFATFALESGFHLPYLGLIPLVPSGIYEAIHWLQYPLLALFGLGVLTRGAASCLALLQGYVLFSDQLNFRNHAYLMFLLLLLFAAVPAPQAVSLPLALRAIRRRSPLREALLGARGALTLQRLIQAQICLVYAFAGLHKLTDAYLHGQVLSGNAATWFYAPPLGAVAPWLVLRLQAWAASPVAMRLPAALTVTMELLLPVGLLARPTRAAAIVLGVLFHAALWLTMNVSAFSFLMVASYVLFLAPPTQRTEQY